MVSMLASSAVDRCLISGRDKPKTIGLVFVASLLSMKHSAERAKTGWLGIGIMCPSGATCLPTDCCFSENSTRHVSLVQRGPHHHLIEN